MALTSGGIQVGWGSQWETLATAINDWYGGGVSGTQYKQVVEMLNSGNYTMEQMEGILQEIPDFVPTYNADGKLIRVTYKATNAGNTASGSIANTVNSNAASATNTQFQTVQNITKDAQTGKVTMSDTVTKYNAGTAGTAKAVASSAIAAVTATAVGISAAKTVDQSLYDANPDFWNSIGMSTLNPETWSQITEGQSTLGATLFNWIFQIDPSTNNPQPYIDEKTYAYMVAYMISQGVFNTGGYEPPVGVTIYNNSAFSYPINTTDSPIVLGDIDITFTDFHAYSGGAEFFVGLIGSQGRTFNIYAINRDNNFNAYREYYNYGNLQHLDFTKTQVTLADGTTAYVGTAGALNVNAAPYILQGTFDYLTIESVFNVPDYTKLGVDLANILYLGSGGEPVEGITPQTGVTQFDASNISDPSDIDSVLQALQIQFPDLWDNRIEVSPDGETVIRYIPVGFPTGGTGEQPTTNGATATDLAPDITGDGDNATDELIKTLIDMLQNPQSQNGMESDTTTPTEPIDPNMPNGGSGITPPFVIPTGSASALYSVYNPSQSQLNSLGAWLWSSNFVDQLLKLFNDPMQAIIGLHKIFATPPTSGTGTIKVGYLDSGVGSNLVNAQYTEVDCGTVSIPEYFKNVLDYLKTDIYLYLPFVGIVPLNVEDVTRANINVKYKVDVLTGACLATVNVTRDANGGGQLYVYAGNCAVQYPLSSGSYMGIVAGALGIAGSVASSVLSGGALLPMALGAGASAMGNMKTKVEHSGSLGGNAGAMGIKKPYLIIRRPQTKIASYYDLLAGGSTNVYGVLASYTGLTRVKYVHLENIPATDEELTQIEELLKSGVMI